MNERMLNALKQVAYVAISEELAEQCNQNLFVADYFGIPVEILNELIEELGVDV